MKRTSGAASKPANTGTLDLDDLNELGEEDEFVEEEDGEELEDDLNDGGEEEDGNHSGGSTHSLHSAGSSHSLHSNGGSSSNLSKSRVSAIMASHKKTMRRSASAPSVAREDLASRKRNRTTPEQLMILEEAFTKNPSPNAQLRDHIAEKVDMTGRSVQIWFQNRRAKEKKTQRGTGGVGGDHALTGVKAPMGSFAAQFQQLQPSFHPGQFGPSPGMTTITPSSLTAHPSSATSQPAYFVPPHMRQQAPQAVRGNRTVFNVDRLKIGSWTRLTIMSGDLLCKIDPGFQTMCWEIIEGPHRCKIEFGFACITAVDLQVVNEQVSLLTVMLTQVPSFFLEVRLPDGKPAWKACNDITEDQQASQVSKHVVQARTSLLNHFLVPLIKGDPFLSTVSTFKNQAMFNTPPPLPERPAIKQEAHRPEEQDYEAEKTMKKSYSVPAISMPRSVSQFAPLEEPYPEYLSEEVLGTSLEFADLGYQTELLNPDLMEGAQFLEEGYGPLS